MNGIQRCAGINISASRLQLLEVEKESNQLYISNLGQAFINPSVNLDDLVDNDFQTRIQNAFDEIKIRNPVRSSVASFTLPPELFITIQLPYDSNLSQNEIKDEFTWELEQLYPYLRIKEYAVKFYDIQSGFLPGKNNALVVALNKKYLILVKNFCLKNNLTPKLVDSSSITANSFIINSLKPAKGSVIVNIFNSKYSVTLFVNVFSGPAFVKMFQKIDDSLMYSSIKEIIHAKFKEVIAKTSTTFIMTGESITGELIKEIQDATGLDFKIFNPLDIILLRPEILKKNISTEQLNSFIPAAGIASRFN